MKEDVFGGGEGSSSTKKGRKLPWFQASNGWSKDEFEFFDEEEEFGEKTECRICHDLEFISKLEAPCACKGTIKVHYLIIYITIFWIFFFIYIKTLISNYNFTSTYIF